MGINFFNFWEQIKLLTSYSIQSPWLLTDYTFLFVLGFFLLFYAFITENIKWRNIYILAFSLFFYYKSSGLFLLVLIGIIIFDFLIVKFIDKQSGFKKKIYFYLALLYNLSFLFFFKYSITLIATFNAYLGTSFNTNDWLFPIGVTFYIFQSISYLVDVYRKEIEPVKKITDFAFYMTFFPHIIAGPVIRAKDFLHQLSSATIVSSSIYKEGMIRITMGLIKKLLIADSLGSYVNMIHESPVDFTGFENLISYYAFSFQLFFDLSGYADVAIGVALLLGFRIKENFDRPYLSKNISEFWKKWHISISNWFKDYVYIPLGGSKGKLVWSYGLILLVMLMGGILHGIDKRFIFLGLAHGAAIIIHKIWIRLVKTNSQNKIYSLIGILITFHFVSFCWIFLRANSFSNAVKSLNKVITNTNYLDFFGFSKDHIQLIILLIISGCIVFIPNKLKSYLNIQIMRLPTYIWLFILLITLQVIIQFGNEIFSPFIYLQF